MDVEPKLPIEETGHGSWSDWSTKGVYWLGEQQVDSLVCLPPSCRQRFVALENLKIESNIHIPPTEPRLIPYNLQWNPERSRGDSGRRGGYGVDQPDLRGGENPLNARGSLPNFVLPPLNSRLDSNLVEVYSWRDSLYNKSTREESQTYLRGSDPRIEIEGIVVCGHPGTPTQQLSAPPSDQRKPVSGDPYVRPLSKSTIAAEAHAQ